MGLARVSVQDLAGNLTPRHSPDGFPLPRAKSCRSRRAGACSWQRRPWHCARFVEHCGGPSADAEPVWEPRIAPVNSHRPKARRT